MNIRQLYTQFIYFLGVSGIGWLIDCVIYFFLAIFLKFSIIVSNYTSSLVAVTFVFIVSTQKIFKNNPHHINLKVKYVIYIVYQLILIYLMSLLGQFIYDKLAVYSVISLHTITIIVKICITPITMFINFLVMRKLTAI